MGGALPNALGLGGRPARGRERRAIGAAVGVFGNAYVLLGLLWLAGVARPALAGAELLLVALAALLVRVWRRGGG